MPNYCKNYIEITGNSKEVKEIVTTLQKDGFEGFIPIPEELKEAEPILPKEKKDKLIKKYGYATWWDFANAKWGTKTTHPYFIFQEADFKNGSYKALFETAWSSPVELFTNIINKYPSVKIKLYFIEPWMGFLGYAHITDGYIDIFDEYDWSDRFKDAWFIYKHFVKPDEELLQNLLEENNVPDEIANKVKSLFPKLTLQEQEALLDWIVSLSPEALESKLIQLEDKPKK